MISSKIEPLWYSNNFNQRLSAVSELLMLFRMIFDKDGKISEVFWFSFPMWKRVWSSQCNNVKRTWTYWTILWACFSQNKINHIYVPCLPVYSKIYLASKSTKRQKRCEKPCHSDSPEVQRLKILWWSGVCLWTDSLYLSVSSKFFTGNTFKFPVEICKFFCQSRMVASCVLCVFYGKVTVRLVCSFSRSFKNYTELLDGLKNSLCYTLLLMFHMAPLFPSTLQSASCLLFITLWQWYHGTREVPF